MDRLTRVRAPTGGALCLCASMLLPVDSRAAEGQVFESYSLNLATIAFAYYPGREAAPFGLDLTLTEEGRLLGRLPRLHKATDVTLKRGVIHQVGAEEVQTILTGPVVAKAAGEAILLGTFETTLVGAPSGTSTPATEAVTVEFPAWPDMAAASTGDLDALVTFQIADGAAALAQFSMRFHAAPGVQLVCRPAALCNRPGPGEPLIVRLPRLAPGEELEVVLEVDTTPARGSGLVVPVKIKHGV